MKNEELRIEEIGLLILKGTSKNSETWIPANVGIQVTRGALNS